MHLTLKPGEHVSVQFEGTDGEFEIHFATQEFPNQIVVRETAGLKDSEGRGDSLYRETFGNGDDWNENDTEDAEAEATAEDYELRAHSSEIDVEPPESKRVGFFLDDCNRIQCTSLVLCDVSDVSWLADDPKAKPDWVVNTFDSKGSVTGEYTFYPTLEELEAASGIKLALTVV